MNVGKSLVTAFPIPPTTLLIPPNAFPIPATAVATLVTLPKIESNTLNAAKNTMALAVNLPKDSPN